MQRSAARLDLELPGPAGNADVSPCVGEVVIEETGECTQ